MMDRELDYVREREVAERLERERLEREREVREGANKPADPDPDADELVG